VQRASREMKHLTIVEPPDVRGILKIKEEVEANG